MGTKLKNNRIVEALSLALPATALLVAIDRLFGYYIAAFSDIYNIYIGIGLLFVAAASLCTCLFIFRENKGFLTVELCALGVYIFYVVVKFWLFLFEREYYANYNSFEFTVFNRKYIADAGFRNIYRNFFCTAGCYILIMSLYSFIKHLMHKKLLSTSLLYRGVRFLTKGKSIRRTMSLYIIASVVPAAVISFVLWNISGNMLLYFFDSPNMLIAIIIIFTLLIGTMLLLAFINRRGSVVRDMDTICGEINSLSDSEIPDSTAISEKSVLHDTANKLVNVGNSMKQAIDKGIAGEKLKVELITNVSHDLKTPMTSIVGYGELLEKMELPPEAKEYVTRLNHKSKYLLAMLEDVFDLSKASTGNAVMNMMELDIVKLINQTLGEAADVLEKSGAKLCLRLPDKGIMVNTDGTRMHRVFQNLLDNAVKYSLAGSRIFVTVSREKEEVNVEIMNTSSYEMNFTPERITERFVRGSDSRTGEGSGIGLAIAKTYTESCGGRFEINIKGDLFTALVSLPVCSTNEK